MGKYAIHHTIKASLKSRMIIDRISIYRIQPYNFLFSYQNMEETKKQQCGIKLGKFINYSFDAFLQQTSYVPTNHKPTRKHIGLTRTKKINSEQVIFPSFIQAQLANSPSPAASNSDEEINNKYNKIKSKDHPSKIEDKLFSEITEIQMNIEVFLNKRKQIQEDHKAWIENRKRIISDVYKYSSFYSHCE